MVSKALSALAVSAMVVVALISSPAAVLVTVILPVVAVRATLPEAVETPFTPSTVPTLKPSISVYTILPVVVVKAMISASRAAASSVMAPPADTSRFVTIMAWVSVTTPP